MTSPCDQCPFLATPQMKRGFTLARLKDFARNQFPCHKTADSDNEESEFRATEKSIHCAGALIFNEKRGYANQMMRICERLGTYDASKLNMEANVR
jgi:hypothetical protein